MYNGKNKLFFFISQEYYSQLVPQASSVNILVPTAAERTGDFSHSVDGSGRPITIVDPTTGLPFAGNMIPSSRIYAPGQAILNFLPSPNTTAGGFVYNYTSQVPSSYPRRETILRGDYQINSDTRLSVRWVHNYDNQQFAYGTTTASWNWPLTNTDRMNGPGQRADVVAHSQLRLHLGQRVYFWRGSGRRHHRTGGHGGHSRHFRHQHAAPLSQRQYERADPQLDVRRHRQHFQRRSTLRCSVPSSRISTIYQVTDNLSKVWGKHLFKVGVYFQSAANASNSQNTVESNIDFSTSATNPLTTGNPFANALLGVYNSYSQQSAKVYASYVYKEVSFYLQDTWKIRSSPDSRPGRAGSPGISPSRTSPDPKLTSIQPTSIPLKRRGSIVRCASELPPARPAPPLTGPTTGHDCRSADDLANTLSSFYVGKLVPNSGNLDDGMELTTNGYPPGGVKPPLILPQPRIGIAWDVTGNQKTVVRGGFGITFDRPESFTSFAANNPPYVLQPTLSNGYLSRYQPGGSGALSPLTVSGVTENMTFPSVYSYSMGVQRNLGQGTVVDVSYVGSQSRHNPRRTNLNAPRYGITFTAAGQDPTKYANGIIPAVEPSLPAAYSAAGVTFSGSQCAGDRFPAALSGLQRRHLLCFDGNSTYNSLQVSLHRRFAKSFTTDVAYTFSRVTTTVSDDSTYTNILSPRRYDYGLATFDRTHAFVWNFVWDLPGASRFLGGNRFAKAVVDNWECPVSPPPVPATLRNSALSISGQDAGNRLEGTPTTGNLSGQQPRFFVNGRSAERQHV